MTITADQLAGSDRLFALADEARQERKHWRESGVRHELDWIAKQLDEAGRMALTASNIWADSWAEAGVLTIRKYTGLRKLIEHT